MSSLSNCKGLAPLSKIMLITIVLGVSTLLLTLLLPITVEPVGSRIAGRDVGELVANAMESGFKSSSSCSLGGSRLVVEVSSFSHYEVRVVVTGREEIVENQPITFIRIYGLSEVFNQELASRNCTCNPPICISYCVDSSSGIYVRPLVQYSKGDVEEHGRRLLVLKVVIPVLRVQGLSAGAGDVTINFLSGNSTVKEYMRFFSSPTSASLIINGLPVLTCSFSPYTGYQGLIVRVSVQQVLVNLVSG